MKHTMRIRKRKSSANPTWVAKEDEEHKVIRALTEVFSSVSLDDAIYAYREANGDANKAAKILERAVTEIESSKKPFTSSTTSGGSNVGLSSGSGWGSSEGFESGCIQNLVSEKGFRGKQNRVVAVAGIVSTVLGKEYVSSIPRRGPTSSEMSKQKGFGNGGAVGKEEVE